MSARELIATTKAMVVKGKGLLAMDESTPTCNQRFEKIGIPQTEEARRSYRELIVTTPGLGEFISGVILYCSCLACVGDGVSEERVEVPEVPRTDVAREVRCQAARIVVGVEIGLVRGASRRCKKPRRRVQLDLREDAAETSCWPAPSPEVPDAAWRSSSKKTAGFATAHVQAFSARVRRESAAYEESEGMSWSTIEAYANAPSGQVSGNLPDLFYRLFPYLLSEHRQD